MPPRSHRPEMKPGQMVFTRISGPSARARERVIVFSAPFEAEYAIEEPTPITPATEEMLTIEP